MSRLLAVLALVVLAATSAAAEKDDIAIRHLINSTFDKSDSRVTIDPIVVVGDHAIAGWTQGDMGGRALLRRKEGNWQFFLCSGDGIKSSSALQQTGIAPADADRLSQALEAAESQVASERRAQFSRFEGTVMMGPGGDHNRH